MALVFYKIIQITSMFYIVVLHFVDVMVLVFYEIIQITSMFYIAVLHRCRCNILQRCNLFYIDDNWSC